jgi:hypothetical protein
VRLRLQGVTAQLASGSVVDRVRLTTDPTLVLGGTDQAADIVISVPDFLVERDAGVRRTIVFELRSSQWLTSGSLQTGRVEDAALRDAIRAATRSEPR